MPQLDLDGANSKISADTIRGQSGTTVTVQSGHNLVGSGSGLTALPAGNLTGSLPAISGAALTGITTGKVVQYVYNINSAVATSSDSNGIDNNDTQPEVASDGDLFMSQAITPTNTNNILHVQAIVMLSFATAGRFGTAYITQDSGNALACQIDGGHANADATTQVVVSWMQVAGTTSSTTFKLYAGSNWTGTTTFNGAGGNRKYGGYMASTMSITEISV